MHTNEEKESEMREERTLEQFFIPSSQRTAHHLQRMNSCKCNKRIFVLCSARSFLLGVLAQCVCVRALLRSCS